MKGLRVVVVLGVVLVVSLIAGAYAAGQDRPPMTAAQAQEFTVRAFTFSGAEPVELSGEPRAEEFPGPGTPEPDDDDRGDEEGQDGDGVPAEPVPVWVVPVTVSGRPVELYVARSGNSAVNLDDTVPGGGYVLNQEQFERLAQFRFDPAGDRLRDGRQGPALVAGLLIVVAGVFLLVAVLRGRERTTATPSSGVPEATAEPTAQPTTG